MLGTVNTTWLPLPAIAAAVPKQPGVSAKLSGRQLLRRSNMGFRGSSCGAIAVLVIAYAAAAQKCQWGRPANAAPARHCPAC